MPANIESPPPQKRTFRGEVCNFELITVITLVYLPVEYGFYILLLELFTWSRIKPMILK